MNHYRDRIRVHIEEKEYSVVGGEFREMLAAVKQIAGRRFVGELKVWKLPGTAQDIQHQLDGSGYTLQGGTPISKVPAPARPQTSTDRIRIKVGEHSLSVIGGAFRDMLNVVRSLPGRRFNSQDKIWEIPGDVGVIKGQIESAGFQLEGAENIPLDPVPEMEPPSFSSPNSSEVPQFEPPDFQPEFQEESLTFESPDWVDESEIPEPPPEPPGDWWADHTPPPELAEEPPPMDWLESPSDSSADSSQDTRDQIQIRLGEDTFLTVTGGTFKSMLKVVKKIPGRRFNSQDKIWEIPGHITLDELDRTIREAGFNLEPKSLN